MKIKDLQERYGLKTRQSIYDWILSSSDVEALIGVKPKGEMFHRGGNVLFNIKLMIFILIFTYEYTKPGF